MKHRLLLLIAMMLALSLVTLVPAFAVPAQQTMKVNDSALITSAIQADTTALVVSPATNTMILAKHTDTLIYDQFTVDAVAISPQAPVALSEHVVASIQVVAASPPTQFGSFSFTSTQLKWKNFMVAADTSPQLSEVVVVISSCGQIMDKETQIAEHSIAADIMSPTPLMRSAVAKLPQDVVVKAHTLVADPSFAIAV